ncbi:MAG: Holliday junction branch migration protein RuvA [Clostridia bacterium]
MINFICGEIVALTDNCVIINNNDIGYEIIVSNNTLVDCSNIGEKKQLHIHMQVKEDCIALYGFINYDEKQMFLKLISVGGIGPKLAMSILSGISVNDLAIAILNNDTARLLKIKGLGKKIAERVVLELKEKVSPMNALLNSIESTNSQINSDTLIGIGSEAATVLASLGLNRNEAVRRVKAAINSGCNTAEEILNFALKNRN